MDSRPERVPRLYDELAAWWPLLSAPADYAGEAAEYAALLGARAERPVREVLELGSGGGNNASFLKASFRLTLVDRAPGMLAVSRELNPECEHVRGDMRDVRLGREFDAVFVHDAVSYLTAEDELEAALRTAWEHLRPGGAVLLVPDELRETFRPSTSHGGHDGPERSSGRARALRYLSWTWDPDPGDTTYSVAYAYLLREGDDVRSLHDRHTLGLFPRRTWRSRLAATGFAASEHVLEEAGPRPAFSGVKPREP